MYYIVFLNCIVLYFSIKSCFFHEKNTEFSRDTKDTVSNEEMHICFKHAGANETIYCLHYKKSIHLNLFKGHVFLAFLKDLGRKYILQQLSVAVQRGNSASIMGTSDV